MAEFVEVMDIKRRMCKYYDDCSDGCPLDNTNFCALSEESLTTKDFKEAENIMLEWAEEHLLEYPYMIDVLSSSFNMRRDLDGREILLWLNTTRISEEIAQKLGIQPKEN
jgi:hypothetical protein